MSEVEIASLVDALESELEREVDALKTRNWKQLRTCGQRKRALLSSLEAAWTRGAGPEIRQRALRVRERAERNLQLAKSLSGELISMRVRRPALRYSRRATVSDQYGSILKVRG